MRKVCLSMGNIGHTTNPTFPRLGWPLRWVANSKTAAKENTLRPLNVAAREHAAQLDHKVFTLPANQVPCSLSR